MPKPVKSGGRINFKSFSTVFLLSVSNPLMMAQKNNSGKHRCYFFMIYQLGLLDQYENKLSTAFNT